MTKPHTSSTDVLTIQGSTLLVLGARTRQKRAVWVTEGVQPRPLNSIRTYTK